MALLLFSGDMMSPEMQHRFCRDNNCNRQNNLYTCSTLVTVSLVNTFYQQRIATLTVTVIPIA